MSTSARALLARIAFAVFVYPHIPSEQWIRTLGGKDSPAFIYVNHGNHFAERHLPKEHYHPNRNHLPPQHHPKECHQCHFNGTRQPPSTIPLLTHIFNELKIEMQTHPVIDIMDEDYIRGLSKDIAFLVRAKHSVRVAEHPERISTDISPHGALNLEGRAFLYVHVHGSDKHLRVQSARRADIIVHARSMLRNLTVIDLVDARLPGQVVYSMEPVPSASASARPPPPPPAYAVPGPTTGYQATVEEDTSKEYTGYHGY